MTIPEVIPAEVSGYCDLETGECVTVDPITSDDKTAHRSASSDATHLQKGTSCRALPSSAAPATPARPSSRRPLPAVTRSPH